LKFTGVAISRLAEPEAFWLFGGKASYSGRSSEHWTKAQNVKVRDVSALAR
jgi:hypothetical protein